MIALVFKLAPLGLPFLDQMYYTLILTIVIIVGVSLTTNPHDEDPKAIYTTAEMFKTSPAFNIGSYIILLINTGYTQLTKKIIMKRRFRMIYQNQTRGGQIIC